MTPLPPGCNRCDHWSSWRTSCENPQHPLPLPLHKGHDFVHEGKKLSITKILCEPETHLHCLDLHVWCFAIMHKAKQNINYVKFKMCNHIIKEIYTLSKVLMLYYRVFRWFIKWIRSFLHVSLTQKTRRMPTAETLKESIIVGLCLCVSVWLLRFTKCSEFSVSGESAS